MLKGVLWTVVEMFPSPLMDIALGLELFSSGCKICGKKERFIEKRKRERTVTMVKKNQK